MIKSLNLLGIEGIYLNIIKAICDKPTVNYYTQWKKKLESLSLRKNTRLTALTTSTQYSTGSPHWNNWARQINKRHLNQKRRSEIVTICWRYHSYIENPRVNQKAVGINQWFQ